MKHFYTTANLDREYIQEAWVSTKAYLEARGAKCLLYHAPERTEGGVHIDGVQVSGNTERAITIGGDSTLIQAARGSAGRNILMLGVNRGHLGCLNQVNRQGDIAPVLESLLNERYRLERRIMIRGTAWGKEEILSRDIMLNEIAITRRNPLKVPRYGVYINDEYLNEYTADGVLVAMSTGSVAYNLPAGEPVMAPGVRMMVLTPVCFYSLNAGSIVLAPEDRIRTRVLNSSQVVSFDGDTSMESKARDCIDIWCSELQTVVIRLKQISFIQNLSNHLGGLQTTRAAKYYKSTRRETSHIKIERHNETIELIREYETETQEELTERLNEAGFNMTWAVASRDTREPELTKTQSESGRQRYMVLENPRETSATKYIRILRDGYMSMDIAQNILVIKTVPGMAMAVVATLDTIQFHEIVGCIAGDDTVICTVRNVDNIIIVMEKIKKMAEGQRKRGAIRYWNYI